jgi:rubrerythrin
VAAKFDAPLISGLLQGIAQDSLKHTKLLKSITDSSAYAQEKAKEECSSKLASAWSAADSGFKEEIESETLFGPAQLDLMEKLAELEAALEEEYSVFLEEEALALLAKEVSGYYTVRPNDIKNIFLGIINDEKHHKKTIATIIELLSQDKSKSSGNAPFVKYQNPGSW